MFKEVSIMYTFPNCIEEETVVKYRDENIEIRAKEIGFGCWKTWIKDLKTGREKTGPYCPGNPDYFTFDTEEEIWIFKEHLISITKYW